MGREEISWHSVFESFRLQVLLFLFLGDFVVSVIVELETAVNRQILGALTLTVGADRLRYLPEDRTALSAHAECLRNASTDAEEGFHPGQNIAWQAVLFSEWCILRAEI